MTTTEPQLTLSDPFNIPKVRTPPWQHQKNAFWFAYQRPGVMLAMDMGTGKSKVVIDIIAYNNYKRILIICPLSVVDVWPKQIATHGLISWEVCQLGKRVGSVKMKHDIAKRLSQLVALKSLTIVTIINYESVWREPFRSWALAQSWDLVVLDESQRIKMAGGKASLFASRLANSAKHRLCLTGTPMPHSPLDIYAQYRFLDKSVFGTSANRFKRRYAIMGGYGGYEIIGWQNEEELQTKFRSLAFQVGREVLDLPETLDVERIGLLEGKGKRIYRDLSKDLIAELEAGTVTAANALVRLLRLQQVTSGFAKVEEDSKEIRVGAEKAQLLRDTLEELAPTEPVVVFCRFRHDLDMVHEVAISLGRTSQELSGRVNELAEWQSDDAPPILAVQIQSGGVGIDLTRARYAIYYSLGFSLGDYLQSRARLHRPGQKCNVTYVHLIIDHTVDRQVYRALAEREEVISRVLQDLKTGA